MRSFLPRLAIFVATAAPCLAGGCSRGNSEAPASSSGAAPSSSAVAAASSSAPATPPPFPISAASVQSVINPDNLPVYSGPTGSVEGTITVTGPRAPDVPIDTTKCPAALDTYGKLFREGTPAAPGGPRPLADAVVVVVGYSGFVPDKTDVQHLTIGTNCAYPSRTIAITYGQRLEISNKTSLLFAPVIDSTMTPAVMVAPPLENGEPVRVYPTRSGRFQLTDRLQIFVNEDLYVFRHPLHAVTDASGHYRIDGLPVGKLKVGVTHPAFEGGAESPVDVVAGVVQTVDLGVVYKPKAPKKPYVDPTLPPLRLRND